jgi:hypothetical protein
MSRRLQRARILLRQRLTDRGVSLGVLLVALGLAVWGVRNTASDNTHTARRIREAMVPFKAVSAGGQGLESALAELLQGNLNLDQSRLAELARQAGEAAVKLGEHRPAKQPEQWQEWTSEMQQAATQLTLASRQGDELSIFAAARRLNSSCVQCHEVFRH